MKNKKYINRIQVQKFSNKTLLTEIVLLIIVFVMIAIVIIDMIRIKGA